MMSLAMRIAHDDSFSNIYTKTGTSMNTFAIVLKDIQNLPDLDIGSARGADAMLSLCMIMHPHRGFIFVVAF